MKTRCILSALAALLWMTVARADDTNKPAGLDSNSALTILSAIGDAGDAAQPAAVAVATNKPAWESSVSFGLTLTRGNSDTILANSTFATHRNNPTNEWTFGADASYGEANSVENNETLHGFGQYNHLFNDRWFGYARADALHDGIADVKYRVTLSPGVGYYFIKTKATRLAGEIGPGVVFEKLDSGVNDIYMTPRFAERFDHKINDHSHLWEKAEFLPQVDRWGNFLVNAEVGIEAAITKHINLRTVLQDNFANEPAPDRKNNDVQLVSGLVYKF